MSQSLKVALGQISPVLLNRDATLAKVAAAIEEAAQQGAELIVFGEALVPGYPIWIERTNGAEFNSSIQKQFYRLYLEQSVDIQRGDLAEICVLAKTHGISVYLGLIEKAVDRGGFSVFSSLVYIDEQGQIQSIHRKIMPTYEERLYWAIGDGHGLQTHRKKKFILGGLNCWENWLPLPRAALYAAGESVHIAVWPGSRRNTEQITRFIAQEMVGYCISVSSPLQASDIPNDFPLRSQIVKDEHEWITDGGSCVSDPIGNWVLEPQCFQEAIFYVELDHNKVLEERLLRDPSGHYSRPDITKLSINRDRQNLLGEA